MRLNPALRYVLLTLLCVSVLVARVSGAHMHFCLDGSEPRASLHVMDGFDMRHDAGMDAPHHDVDILLGEQTLSKSGQLSVDLPLLLIATLCLLLLRPKRRESLERKSVGEGKSVSVRVDLGGRRILKKQKHYKQHR